MGEGEKIAGWSAGKLVLLEGLRKILKYQPCLSMAPSSAFRQGLRSTAPILSKGQDYDILYGFQ